MDLCMHLRCHEARRVVPRSDPRGTGGRVAGGLPRGAHHAPSEYLCEARESLHWLKPQAVQRQQHRGHSVHVAAAGKSLQATTSRDLKERGSKPRRKAVAASVCEPS